MVLMGLLAYVFVRKVGCNCPECSVRMAFFSEVPEEEKREILDYFEKYESRRPREDRLLVCPKCGLVYDDFSGEGRSLDADERSECKVCGKSVEVMAQYIISGEITQIVVELSLKPIVRFATRRTSSMLVAPAARFTPGFAPTRVGGTSFSLRLRKIGF